MSGSSTAASGDRVTLEVGGTSDSAFNEIDLGSKKGADSAKEDDREDEDHDREKGGEGEGEDEGTRGEGDDDDEGYSPDRARLRASRRSERRMRTRSNRLETQVVRMAAQLEELEGTARTAIVGDARSKMEQAQAKFLAAKEKAKKAFDEGKSDEFFRAQDEQRVAENEYGAAARAVQEIESNTGNTGGTAVRNRWMSENDWFNPEGQDADSELARKVSREVAQDGFETKSQAHFDELDRRLRKLKPKGPWADNGDDDDQDEDRDTRRGKGRDQEDGGRGGRERDRGPRGGANGNGSGGLDGQTDWNKNTKVPRQLIENYQAAGFDVNDPKIKQRMLERYNDTKRGMSGGTVNVG